MCASLHVTCDRSEQHRTTTIKMRERSEAYAQADQERTSRPAGAA